MPTPYPVCHGDPSGIELRGKLPAARVESIAAGFRSKRVNQKAAGIGIARNDLLQGTPVVGARLLFRPFRCAGWERLQTKNSARQIVAGVTTGVTRPLSEKDGLDPGLKEVVVQDIAGAWRGRGQSVLGRSIWSSAATDPSGQHLPLGILLGVPK